jgi:predicted component of type VI protein secretion system
MALNAKLVVVGGDVKTAEIKLRLPSTIGRGRGTTIMLPHPLVSRQHCELFEENGQLMVRDLGSLNGTFVNNHRISESPLPPGELLTIGTVTFRAVYDSDSAIDPPGAAVQVGAGRVAGPNGEVHAGPATEDAPPAAHRGQTLEGTGPYETTLEESPANVPSVNPPAAESGPSPRPTEPAPAPAKQDDETVDVSSFPPTGEEHVGGNEDDDDLGDFLKSLGK